MKILKSIINFFTSPCDTEKDFIDLKFERIDLLTNKLNKQTQMINEFVEQFGVGTTIGKDCSNCSRIDCRDDPEWKYCYESLENFSPNS